jgi:hypothetical protein
VVPRAWTIYFAEMSEAEVPDDLPPAWLERAQAEAGQRVPARLSEPGLVSPPADDDAIRRSIEATKQAIFPFHRLA